MEDNFTIEIISPEKIIFSGETKTVKVPSYEGDMSLLKDHVSIISFLRPGIVKVEKKDGSFENFFVEDGIVEFFNNTLILLSATAKSIKDISKEFLDVLTKNTEEEIKKENTSDQDHYVLNHKLDVIKDIKI
jgi:F-type H+-transporting ATPase subunit epsilon